MECKTWAEIRDVYQVRGAWFSCRWELEFPHWWLKKIKLTEVTQRKETAYRAGISRTSSALGLVSLPWQALLICSAVITALVKSSCVTCLPAAVRILPGVTSQRGLTLLQEATRARSPWEFVTCGWSLKDALHHIKMKQLRKKKTWELTFKPRFQIVAVNFLIFLEPTGSS